MSQIANKIMVFSMEFFALQKNLLVICRLNCVSVNSFQALQIR